MKFRMRMEYPDGTVCAGKKDFVQWTDHLGITDFDFSGLRVHDVATDEGWWAFWAEQHGAAYVEASDVEDFSHYDWGWHRDQQFIDEHNAARGGRSVFDFHHANLKSKVLVKRQSVYDISGQFDVIFCHGLLYHLRHPLLAIDRMRAACSGMLIMETFVDDNRDSMAAEMKFYRTHEIGPISNWTGATTACVASWLRDAGFSHVFFCDPQFPRHNRQTFVALVTDQWLNLFRSNLNLRFCDGEYWKTVFEHTRINDRARYQDL
jgi:tRNA (mo5U34)-methyltransferase